MDILTAAGQVIYGAMALAALYGVFCVILLLRRIRQKRFTSRKRADDFLAEIQELLAAKDFDSVAQKCDSPPYWSKAVPQLIMVAIENRESGLPRIRRAIGERFERDILADLEYRTSWISTIVKSAPMLGLLGTVVGMINAFKAIAVSQSQGGMQVDALAQDISFALITTALGLTIALPLVLAGNMISVRIGKMQDGVQEQMGTFLDDLDAAVQR